ncbi:uncharacterized protein LOC105692389 [Athalia rosae]|uniref:uncharacterized protein LOC105692389 n=1 Tax=Athalia rosae TaxID=37344 RepID=UPI00203328EC|nr:uncharacterized protein LOC105692389 [Athalia rosae]XP_012266980.2 uncharacterized protein LOC105692389 [Athalia rosae]XP_012266981.2 uncharacterized protein LOC105692389 [Athalia rosae]XP_048515591.1 uncharacterized protein LOC105692389 [Athalia rosae]XP_048515592.1 uncharacterized protein LOC105692389 [Athalia rosae]
MLSYMLPATEDKPPPDNRNGNLSQMTSTGRVYRINDIHQSVGQASPGRMTLNARAINALQSTLQSTRTGDQIGEIIDEGDEVSELEKNYSVLNGGGRGSVTSNFAAENGSPRHNESSTTTATTNAVKKTSSLYTGPGRAVVKDDSLYSIGSDASSTVGSEKKHKLFNGAKHASLKRVSFGSSKGSMVETLVYETPVQEEPENNHFLEYNGRLSGPITLGSPLLLAPETDEGRERVRVSLLEPTPCPSTPGVLLLEPVTSDLDDLHLHNNRTMATSPAELLTTHTEHTTPTYHTQISTDSGWDNPFRPDGDLSREADEIVELIKGGKPITPTPGQIAPPLPGVETTTPVTSGAVANAATVPANGTSERDSGASPLLNSTLANQQNSPRLNQGNGNAHATPNKGATNNAANNQHAAHEKVATSVNAATVEVGRVTAQGPGDASQVEHVTLKKKPKCKCCVLQ